MSFQLLLEGESSKTIRDRIVNALDAAQFGVDNPVHTRTIIRALGETGVIPDLAARAITDPAVQLFYVHLAELLSPLKAAAATELLMYQLQCLYPLFRRLGQESSLAESLAVKILRGEIECGRLFYSSEANGNTVRSLDIQAHAKGWIINGEMPLSLAGVNTDFYPVLVDKSDNESLEVFIIPATAEAIQIMSSAPVSVDAHYVLGNLAVHNLVLSADCRLGAVDRTFYRQLVAQHQAMDAVSNNQTSRVALDTAIDFLRNRLSNNVPLLKLDVLQQRLAALHAEWSMSRALAYSTLNVQQTDDIFLLANASQSLARKLLQKIAIDSLHLGGINHYRTDSPLARIYQEACWNKLFGVA